MASLSGFGVEIAALIAKVTGPVEEVEKVEEVVEVEDTEEE